MIQSITTFFLFIVLYSSMGQIASDLYLPSLPAITQNLQTTTHLTQLSVSLFMLGYCLSRLVYGPVSDAFGRRKTLLSGLSLCFVGTVVCLSAQNIEMLILGRFLQGFGGAAGGSLGGPVLRDLVEGERLAKFGAYLGIANIFFIAGAPLLGGYLQHYFDWHASFIFLIIYLGIILLLLFFFFPETNRHQSLENINPSFIKKNVITLVSDRSFVVCVICIFCTYASILAWLTLGPILLQNHVGISSVQYGWVVLGVALSYAIGGFINSRLIGRYSMPSLLFFGIVISLFGGLLMLLFALLNLLSVSVIMVPMMLFIFGGGFIFPIAFSSALMPFPTIAGTAVAVIGFIQVLGGVISSTIISFGPDHTQLPLALIIVISASAALIAYKTILPKHNA